MPPTNFIHMGSLESRHDDAAMPQLEEQTKEWKTFLSTLNLNGIYCNEALTLSIQSLYTLALICV